MYPTFVRGCRAQYALGEHGDVFDLLDGGPKDALLEVRLHAKVLAHLGGRVVALGVVDVEAENVHESEGLVLATHGLGEAVRDNGEVVHERKKPCSREHAASTKPFLLCLCGEAWKTTRASSRLGIP